MIIVPDRKKRTLLPLIEKHIAPGSIIVSDEWSSYEELNSMGYRHLTVCHTQNFVNPENVHAHTQTVENMWRWAKQRIRSTSSDPDTKILRMAEFLWRRRYRNFYDDIIEHLADMYFS